MACELSLAERALREWAVEIHSQLMLEAAEIHLAHLQMVLEILSQIQALVAVEVTALPHSKPERRRATRCSPRFPGTPR